MTVFMILLHLPFALQPEKVINVRIGCKVTFHHRHNSEQSLNKAVTKQGFSVQNCCEHMELKKHQHNER